jgi:hypothetical protein
MYSFAKKKIRTIYFCKIEGGKCKKEKKILDKSFHYNRYKMEISFLPC